MTESIAQVDGTVLELLAQTAVVARGLAQLVTNPTFRKWLTNTKRSQLDPAD